MRALARLGERGHQIAADDEALLVGERQVDSGGERRDRRAEPGGADDRVEDQVGLGGRDQLANAVLAGEHHAVVELARGARRRPGVAEGDATGARRARLVAEALPVGRCAEPGDDELLGAADHLERLLADRAGRAEHEYSLGHPAQGSAAPQPRLSAAHPGPRWQKRGLCTHKCHLDPGAAFGRAWRPRPGAAFGRAWRPRPVWRPRPGAAFGRGSLRAWRAR